MIRTLRRWWQPIAGAALDQLPFAFTFRALASRALRTRGVSLQELPVKFNTSLITRPADGVIPVAVAVRQRESTLMYDGGTVHSGAGTRA